jgi:cob(I)alamin adenosyltransferase
MAKRGTLPDKIDHIEVKKTKDLIVVITGNGKGKTTSALWVWRCVPAATA